MGDVAEILGIGNRESGTRVAPAPKPAAASLKSNKGLNHPTTAFTKPVLDALTSSKSTEHSSAPLPPIVPAMVRVNNRFILSNKKARPWCWAPFSSNARNDGLLLHHWVRAGVEYPEYPFARFNVHLDALNYKETDLDGDTFYKGHLQDDNWTQSETDTLLELCRIYELRWPVIIDRWIGKFRSLSNKNVEDLQHRYYTIGMVLNRKLVEKAAKVETENLAKALAASKGSGPSHGMETNDAKAKDRGSLKAQHAIAVAISTSSSDAVSSMVGDVKANMQPPIIATSTGTTNQPTFDLESERQRRRILEKIWDRSKEEELEEETLRAELKLVETQIRKLKKGGGHILAAAAAAAGRAHASGGGSTVPTPASSRGTSPIPGSVAAIGTDASFAMLNAQFTKTAPVPTAGTPYLQSGRLVNPATGGQMAINKTTLKRMEQILKELNVNERPIPTKRVCDMYDHVRKGVLTLLTLQKAMFKNESEVLSRRNRLEKIAGAAVAREIQIKADAASAAAAAAAKEKEKEKAAAEKAKVKPKGGSTKKGGGTTKKATKKKAAGEKGTKRKKPTPKTTTESAAAAPSTSTASVKGDGGDSNPKKRAKMS